MAITIANATRSSKTTASFHVKTFPMRDCLVYPRSENAAELQCGFPSTKPLMRNQSNRWMVHVPTNGLFTAMLKACFPCS